MLVGNGKLGRQARRFCAMRFLARISDCSHGVVVGYREGIQEETRVAIIGPSWVLSPRQPVCGDRKRGTRTRRHSRLLLLDLHPNLASLSHTSPNTSAHQAAYATNSHVFPSCLPPAWPVVVITARPRRHPLPRHLVRPRWIRPLLAHPAAHHDRNECAGSEVRWRSHAGR